MAELATDIVTIFFACAVFSGFIFGFYTGVNAS